MEQFVIEMSVPVEEGDVRSRELVRGWKAGNIWNIDEPGCFWKGLPELNLNKEGSRRSGGKQSKQRNMWAFLSMRQVGDKILS